MRKKGPAHMSEPLIIVPSTLFAEGPLQGELSLLETRYPGKKRIFRYDNANALELKRVLMETSYSDVVICRPSLDVDFTRIQMVRSLALSSTLIVFLPDLSFIRKAKEVQTTDENSGLSKWYSQGLSLQYSLFRHADLVVARTDEDRTLLAAELDGVPVIGASELGRDGAAVSRKKDLKVSIVILTFNQLEMTRQCLESLEKHTAPGHEVIVVDNGSTDGTPQYLNELCRRKSNMQYIYNDTNLGFSKANNQGIKVATGDYILLLNNDVLLTPGWLERMVACAQGDPSVGVVGPCTNNAVGQQVIDTDIEFEDNAIQKFACARLMQKAGNWFETHRIIGFCLLAKREVIDSVGMLDERFGPGGFEDFDFCLRVKQAGYKIMIAEDVFVYHIGGKGYSQNNLDYDKLRHKNVQIFIEKWVKKAMEIMEIMPGT